MSRFKVLKANPRRSLAALATVLVAVGVTGASGADFTAQTANAGNTFTAGTLTMSNDKAGAILTATNMKPGDPATKGEVKIKNTGSARRHVQAHPRHRRRLRHGSNKMSTKLNVVVTDCGADLLCATAADNSAKYTGTLAAMTAPITLSPNWAAAEEHKYEFAVALDSSADNLYAGDNSVVPFTWDAN